MSKSTPDLTRRQVILVVLSLMSGLVAAIYRDEFDGVLGGFKLSPRAGYGNGRFGAGGFGR